MSNTETFLNFNPTESDFTPFQYGEAEFKVLSLEDKVSDNGNDYKNLKIEVIDSAGTKRTLYDKLVMTEKAKWKIRQFCAASGLYSAWKAGSLSDSAILSAKGSAITEPEEYQDKNGATRNRPRIVEYKEVLGFKDSKTKVGGASSVPDIDDEIPF